MGNSSDEFNNYLKAVTVRDLTMTGGVVGVNSGSYVGSIGLKAAMLRKSNFCG